MGLGAALSVVLCLVLSFRPVSLERLINAAYDMQLSLLPKTAVSPQPIVVDIDDRSIEAIGQWPWPRDRVAELLSRLVDLGVRAVGVDLLFAEPDRTSPVAVQRRLQEELNLDLSLAGIPYARRNHDEALANVLSTGPFVLSYYLDFETSDTSPCLPAAASVALLTNADPGDEPHGLHRAQGILCNIPRLAEAAPAAGFINSGPDDDGIYRRTPLLIEYQGRIVPSLGLQTLMTAMGLQQALMEFRAGVLTLRLGDHQVPLDGTGNLLLRFRGPGRSFPFVSAADIFGDRIDRRELSGRIAFVSVSATGLKEYRPTPLDPLFTGVELHATVVDNVLQGDPLLRPPFAEGLELALALGIGLAITLFLAWAGPASIAVLALLAPAGTAVVAQFLLSSYGVVVSPVPAILAVLLVIVGVSVAKYWREHQSSKSFTRQVLLSQEAIIEGFATLAEYRDSDTGRHVKRTQHFVKVLAEQLRHHPKFRDRLDAMTVELMYKTAPLHDIGKIAVPDSVLLNPGRLTEAEFAIMKLHTEQGAAVLRVVEDKLGRNDFLRIAGEIALCHHEKWDGSGYPQGLAGETIPLSARLMAVADVYDALISGRVYKPPYSHQEAVRVIRERAGCDFDPEVVDAFLAVEERLRDVALTFADSEGQRRVLLPASDFECVV